MPRCSFFHLYRGFAFCLWLFAGLAHAQPVAIENTTAPNVMVTIAPLHSLVAMVMQGVGTPELLMRPTADPHHFSLTPSDAQHLQQASLVFEVSDRFDVYLKNLKYKLPNTRFVSLYPGSQSLHPWLSLAEAKESLSAIAQQLGRIDPAHQEIYNANASAARRKLSELGDAIARRLPRKAAPSIAVTHQAYDMFEAYFNLPPSILVAHQQSTGLSSQLLEQAQKQRIRCVFVPHQAGSADLRLSQLLKAKLVQLNVMGAGFPEGPTLYPAIINRMGEKYQECLSQ